MSTTNDILPFCPTDTGTNLEDQADYIIDTNRIDGNQPGIASSKLNNKAIRQATFLASQLAQYICNSTGNNVLDDGDTSALLANIGLTFANPTSSQDRVANLSLAFSVATSAATIAIKTQAGSDATAFSPILVGMRSSTITSGVYNPRSITSALSIVIPSTATLGQTNGNPGNIYVYLIDNAGTLELAVSHTIFPENALVTTTTISTSATSATVIYSTTGRTNVPVRCVGYITQTQATAGTWATTASQIQLLPCQKPKPPTIQLFTSSSGNYVPPPGVLYLRVRMIGGGGGGSGSGTSGGGTGGTGGNTTFGTTLLVAGGGVGSAGIVGGAGGTASLGSGPIGIALTGANGASRSDQTGTSGAQESGLGGSSAFGGAGNSVLTTIAGGSGVTNTGGGGGGGGINSSVNGGVGGGGGAGGFIDAIITNISSAWASSFTYSVGGAGTAGSAGTSGAVGGAGGSGLIEVTEYYQ